METKGILKLEIIINVLVLSYACYGSAAIINVLILELTTKINNLTFHPVGENYPYCFI